PLKPPLDENSVHVWCAELDQPQGRVEYYGSLLSSDERERAARFHFDRHRNAYTAGRGMLRVLLGRYLTQPPEDIDISYSHYGKPLLSDNRLQFNLAHSGGLALFVFTLHDEVGVDIERERDLRDALAIAERFFSPSERAALRELPDSERVPAFFRCWTRKEAFIKAVGEGLSYPLADFDVTLAPGEPARLLSIRGSEEEARRWSLQSLDLPAGNFGAVALQNPAMQLERWRFPPDLT
ncbi:MAG: 4'-phosphopantetheinyl transferase family protein, partial [Candidatus Promineifilaceae bacterium]